MSAKKAWKRLCSKHNPGACMTCSPIKSIVGHLFSSDEFKEDNFVISQMWALLNNEEFHYQNTGSMVNYHFEDSRKLEIMLRDNINVVDWQERLRRLKLLGSGGFGKVYSAKDSITNEMYALKIIDDNDGDDEEDIFSFITYLLRERNSMSELNRCPFFVKLIAAFQSVDTKFTFVLELCICDLRDLHSPFWLSNVSDKSKKYYLDRTLAKRVSKKMNSFLKVKYRDIVFMYLFEMLCALHYLGSRHIVHADIKPENVLISNNGHIKLADFGVSFRNQWFDRASMTMLPLSTLDMEKADEFDKQDSTSGTMDYYDPEMLITDFLYNSDNAHHLQQYYKDNIFFQTMKDVSQNFLSDLYAVGVTFLEIYYGGFNALKFVSVRHLDGRYWNFDIMFDKNIREGALVLPALEMSKNQYTFSIMKLVLSILQPRQLRAQNLLSNLSVYKLGKRVEERYIDIKQVENIVYYRSKKMTKENVAGIIISKKYMNALIKMKMSNSKSPDTDSENEAKAENSDSNRDKIHLKIHSFAYKY